MRLTQAMPTSRGAATYQKVGMSILPPFPLSAFLLPFIPLIPFVPPSLLLLPSLSPSLPSLFPFLGSPPLKATREPGERCELLSGLEQSSAARRFRCILMWKIGIWWVVRAVLKRWTVNELQLRAEATRCTKISGSQTPRANFWGYSRYPRHPQWYAPVLRSVSKSGSARWLPRYLKRCDSRYLSLSLSQLKRIGFVINLSFSGHRSALRTASGLFHRGGRTQPAGFIACVYTARSVAACITISRRSASSHVSRPKAFLVKIAC